MENKEGKYEMAFRIAKSTALYETAIVLIEDAMLISNKMTDRQKFEEVLSVVNAAVKQIEEFE